MQTIITRSTDEAAAVIRSGGLVAFPTETVYGLGADATNERAVRRIFEAKGRPGDNPLIVHIAARHQVDRLARGVPPAAARLIDQFFPGPLTVVLTRSEEIPPIVTAGLGTVGIRMPALEATRAFLSACGTPVAAPSANLSGRPSPTTWQAALADLEGRIECVLQGPQASLGLESTVVDCTGSSPVVLRTGAVSLERLRDVVPDVRLAHAEDELMARSPGTRHRHYAPHAQVIVIPDVSALPAADESGAYIGIDSPGADHVLGEVLVCESLDQYAHELYHFFRAADAKGFRTIYCQTVAPDGIGRAIQDRLIRASRG